MVELVMVVGCSGSGKTTWAHQHDTTHLVVDSDEMRLRLLGDAADQSQNARVFDEMFRITVNALRAGQPVIYSATNLICKRRIAFLKQLKRSVGDVYCRCVIINTPIEVCRERNSARSRIVPAYVIDKQAKQFQCPVENEGWDKIEIVSTTFYDKDALTEKIWDNVRVAGSQDNPHHSLTLYDHLLKCVELVKKGKTAEESLILMMAAANHDIGKISTRTYDDKGIAHYYGHECVGSYMAMNMGFSLRVVQLIGYHMCPYNKEAARAWEERLGSDLWRLISILHEADESAH